MNNESQHEDGEEVRELEREVEETRKEYKEKQDPLSSIAYLRDLCYLAGAYKERGEEEKVRQTLKIMKEVDHPEDSFTKIVRGYIKDNN